MSAVYKESQGANIVPHRDIRRMPNGSSALFVTDTNDAGVWGTGLHYKRHKAQWTRKSWILKMVYWSIEALTPDIGRCIDPCRDVHVRDYYNRIFRIPRQTSPTILHFVFSKYWFKGRHPINRLRLKKRPKRVKIFEPCLSPLIGWTVVSFNMFYISCTTARFFEKYLW